MAWQIDQDGTRVTWTHLFTRLAAAAIYMLVGETTARIVNPLIGSVVHYNELAGPVTTGFLVVHSVGGGSHSLVSVASTLSWVTTPPVACVLGALSNAGLLIHLPVRFGLEHCRVRLHRREAESSGRTGEVVAYMNHRYRERHGYRSWSERRYLTASE